jgi:WD40 repeat protein
MRFLKGQQPPYRGVAYLPDGRALITATQSGVVTLWNLDGGSELTRLAYRLVRIDSIALSPDGCLLAAAGDALTVWDVRAGAIAERFESLPHLRGVAFALNGSRLVASIYHGFATAARECGLAMWDTVDGRALPRFPTDGSARWLTTGPDGQSVFGESGYRVARWHLPSETEHPTQLALTSSSALAASPAAGVVAQGSYRTVEIRDATGERLLARWDAHKKGVFALAFSADGTLLATGGGDEVVKVWDVSGVAGVLADPNALPLTAIPERGAYEWRLGPVRAIAFSPDGLTAAAVGDRVKFVVWDLNTARQIRK